MFARTFALFLFPTVENGDQYEERVVGMQRKIVAVLFLSIFSTALLYSRAHAQSDPEVQSLREQVQSLQQTVEQLQKSLSTMQRETSSRDKRRKQQVETITRQQSEAMAAEVVSPLDQALGELGLPSIPDAPTRSTQPALWRRPGGGGSQSLWQGQLGGGAQARLIDISFNGLFYAGGSSERDEAISTLQGGAHDANQRGFTLGQGEISFSGAVDPFFTAETHLITAITPDDGETIVELEEAFAQTTALPYGLQLELGHFYTEFGQINPQHPHEWDWIDQPVVNSRMFGGDGMRQTGFRASWLTPTPWYSQLQFGMQNADGVNMASFLGGRVGSHGHGGGEDIHDEDIHDEDIHDEDIHDEGGDHEEHGGHDDDEMADHDDEGDDEEHGHGIEGEGIAGRPIIDQDVRGFGDFAYLARWENSFNFTDEITGVIGFSGMYGPNSTGRDGSTWLYGIDMKFRWVPNDSFRQYPFLTWQTEIIRRDYHMARITQETEDGDLASLPGRTLNDWGMYTQLLYGFYVNWSVGLRYEYAGGSGDSVGGRRNDPFRDDRHRVSPLLTYRPTEFSRIRLQYNFDTATHLSNDAHTIWMGYEWLFGAHPAHGF